MQEEWGQHGIASWNTHGWIEMPQRIGAKLASLLLAAPDQVIVADSTSINLFKVVSAAVSLRPGQKVILSGTNYSPTPFNPLYEAARHTWYANCQLLHLGKRTLDAVPSAYGVKA